jgi:hypothetical protein
MAKNIQRKPFTFVAAEDPKKNPTATVHTKQAGLKVKTDFTRLTNAGSLKRGSRHLAFLIGIIRINGFSRLMLNKILFIPSSCKS